MIIDLLIVTINHSNNIVKFYTKRIKKYIFLNILISIQLNIYSFYKQM